MDDVIAMNGGSIMSYCHLVSAGINLNHGFGPEPSALMRGKIANASCLTTCTTDNDNCRTVYADTDGDGFGDANNS